MCPIASPQVAVIVGVGHILLLSLEGGELRQVGELHVPAEVSCIDITPLGAWSLGDGCNGGVGEGDGWEGLPRAAHASKTPPAHPLDLAPDQRARQRTQSNSRS